VGGQPIEFDDDYRRARREDGSVIQFTRAEQAVLASLASHPDRVMTRQQLLDATSGDGSDSSDRNIDFLINRLRRKLRDSPRAPIYIATRYGEGYHWIAAATTPARATRDSVVVVGPVRCARLDLADQARMRVLGRRLATQLDALMGGRGQAAFDEACPPPAAFGAQRPRYGLSCDGLLVGEDTHCVLSLRYFDTAQPIWVHRLAMDQAETLIADLARTALDHLMRSEVAVDQPGAPDTEPLPVRMHRAAALLTEQHDYREVELHMRRTLAGTPDDHVARLMLASALHSRLFMGLEDYFLDDCSPPTAVLDEIEALLLPALPHLSANPIHLLATAKLVYFLDRGHDALALDLAEEALRSSTSFAAAFVNVGQMRCFEGDIEGGWALLEEGESLAEPQSPFVSYIAVLKLQAAMAEGDPRRVEQVVQAMHPALASKLEIHYALLHPRGPTSLLRRELAGYGSRRAAALMRYKHAATGRLFKQARHRANYLGPAYRLLAERLGGGFVPADIAGDLGPWV
jgi:DNA-binding winged helix-turn-helix (wHTH) protein